MAMKSVAVTTLEFEEDADKRGSTSSQIALPDMFRCEEALTAQQTRKLVHCSFDHALHFFFLGGASFVAGPDAPEAERNIFGLLQKVGPETGKTVIAIRHE